MLTCTDAEIESLLEPSEVIAEIRSAFAQGFANVRMPKRVQVELDKSTLLIMPCGIAGESAYGLKIVTVSQQARPEGRVRASYILLDSGTGETVAVFAANHLTDLRTAATTAVATDILARPDASVLGIFGTGRQSAAHIAVMALTRSFQQILVSGSSPEKARAFAQRMRALHGFNVNATDAATCSTTSDVICTCTNSIEPLFSGELLRPGTHLNLIGAFQPHACEVDSVTIQRSRVFVDTYEGALAEAGDILMPIQSGEIGCEHVQGDLHELVSGKKPGRTSRDDITVFKSVGCALEDLVTAKLVMKALQARNAINR
jgi:ornithine cyclodeaminase/alanine dehydrogenase-like protein (mu-crystallin family)